MAHGRRSDKIRLEAAERRLKALELRKAGASYRKIATALGVSLSQAHKDVTSALADLTEQENASAGEYRTLELLRLDDALLAIWKDVANGHLGAIDRLVRIGERRAKLLGLDAPVKLDLTLYNQYTQIVEALTLHDLDASDVFAAMLAELAAQGTANRERG